MVSSKLKKNFIKLAFFDVIIIIILLGLPQFLLVGKGGFAFEDLQRLFFSYSIWGLGYLAGINALFIIEQLVNKGDKKYGDGLGFFSKGNKPSIKTGFDTIDIILLSVIIFGGLGLFATVTNQSFTGVGGLPQQQFTELDNALFRWLLIPLAENLGSAFFLGFTIFSVRTISRRFKWTPQTFRLTAILSGTFIVMSYGLINHLARYGEQQLALVNVGIFWLIGGLISSVIGSFNPFWIMHFANNMFFDFGNLFSSDRVILGTIGFLLIITFIYVIRLINKRKKNG